MKKLCVSLLALALYACDNEVINPEVPEERTPTFESLGKYTISGISGDGSILSGIDAVSEDNMEPHRAFRWENGEWEDIGSLPGGEFYADATGVSNDGSVVIGASSSSNGAYEAFRWHDGTFEGLGDLIGGTFISYANGVSSNGSVAVGKASSADFINEAFRWENGTMEGLGGLSGHAKNSHANDVSGDGAIVVGSSISGNSWEAFRWEDGTMEGIGFLQGGDHSRAAAISNDGSTIVGFSSSSSTSGGWEAFRWQNGTMEGLGDLPGGDFYSQAQAVSENGSVIVGVSKSENNESEVFIWIEGEGIKSLKGMLKDEYGLDLENWRLTFVGGISADGRTVVGNGYFNGDPQAWKASF